MRYLVGILAFGLFFSFASVGADAPAPTPAVSFSSARINFGAIPSSTTCTQLVTVTLDRRVFSSHLPTLVPDRNSQAEVSLFARFDGSDFVRLVYRVTINAFFQKIGPFQDHLSLVDNPNAPVPYPPDALAENDGIIVAGESVQGLEGPGLVDFGNIEAGKMKTKKCVSAFMHPAWFVQIVT